MSVFIGLDGNGFATFIDPEREAYYDRAIARANAIAEGQADQALPCEPPSAPAFGEPSVSISEFAAIVAASGIAAPAPLASLISAIPAGRVQRSAGGQNFPVGVRNAIEVPSGQKKDRTPASQSLAAERPEISAFFGAVNPRFASHSPGEAGAQERPAGFNLEIISHVKKF